MKRRLTLLIASILLATTTLSAKSLVLTLKNGTLVYYLLGGDTNPVMRFTDEGMTVNADKYEFSGIRNFYISDTDDPNGISHTTQGAEASYKNNMLTLSSKETKAIRIYSADGSEISAPVQQKGNATQIDLNALPQGTYIISDGTTSFKVLKK